MDEQQKDNKESEIKTSPPLADPLPSDFQVLNLEQDTKILAEANVELDAWDLLISNRSGDLGFDFSGSK